MLKALGSRLTFANVTSVTALVFAMAGGAYALSGIPDRSGVYHGCVDPKAGALRVVKSASSCRKARTVRRGQRRLRIPGESAIAWNQQGPRGFQGIQGIQGNQGNQGSQGPGATSFDASLPNPTTNGSVKTLDNGLTVIATCNTTNKLVLSLKTTDGSSALQASGTAGNGAGVFRIDSDGAPSLGAVQDTTQAEYDLIARDNAVGRFDHIDLHGTYGSPCTFWGMITPSG